METYCGLQWCLDRKYIIVIDYILKSCLDRAPSYIWNVSDFLNKRRELPTLLNNVLLVTLDVGSLYTNIPNQEEITAYEEVLNLRNHLTPPPDDLCHQIKLMSFLLTRDITSKCQVQLRGPIWFHVGGKVGTRVPAHPDRVPLVWWRYIMMVLHCGPIMNHPCISSWKV